MKTLLAITLFTVLTATAGASTVPVLSCFGTEPFWGISTDAKGVLSFNNPRSDEIKVYPKTELKKASGTPELYAFQIEAHNQAKSTLKLNVVRNECNDGMSDKIYTYTALVDVDGDLLMGCCN